MADSKGSQLAAVALAIAAIVVLPVAMVGAIFTSTSSAAAVIDACETDGGPGGGAQPIAASPAAPSWTGEQMSIAQIIVDVAEQRGLPERAAVIGVDTGIVESGLRNLTFGDRDSLGVFQQRPSQGWGTPEQILNPTYAAGTFYNHLITIPGWAGLPPGVAEQDVQRSGFPERYAPVEPQASALVAKFWSGAITPAPPGGGGELVDLTFGGCPDQGQWMPPLNPPPGKLPPNFQPPADPQENAAVTYALAQVGKPYLWGATGPDAFDCSGLMLAAWAHAGVALDRTTAAQVHDGVAVDSIAQAQPGDLLFIPGVLGTPQNPRHVGMYIGYGMLVDAADEQLGVISEALVTWAPQIVAIRHISGNGGGGGGNGPLP
ncbi:MAG TPA: C40 family peptidase [Pseudonocardiaceae bacterium]